MARRVLWTLTLTALSMATLPLSGQERGRGRGGPVALPDGPGKEIVQARCESCHSLGLIVNSGYTREEWVSLFSSMVALPPNEATVAADYLAKNFPEKPRPRAVVIA